MKRISAILFSLYFISKSTYAIPNICSVVNTPSFRKNLEMSITPAWCGFPPRPCTYVSYNVPQLFTEIVGNSKETFFRGLPFATMQLAATKPEPPHAAEDDNGVYSFHARTLNISFTSFLFSGLGCGGTPTDNMCYTSMSEHLGTHWKTGHADKLQPFWLAWSAAPKACLIKGAVTSATGMSKPTGYPASNAMCSFNRNWVAKFPPSTQPVCTGWGINFPRYGTVTSSDQTTASLVMLSRIRSLGSEVFQSVPTSFTDQFQMIYPQSSTLFREGQNIGVLRLKGVSEMGRLWNMKPKNYLYATWKRVSCTREAYYPVTSQAWISFMQAACRGIK